MASKTFNKSGIAIDFGQTKISGSKILRGKFLNTKKYPSIFYNNSSNYVKNIADVINDLSPLNKNKIGIAISGRVDSYGNWYAVNNKNLGNFKIALKKIIQKKFNLETIIMNDATAACLGEAIFGAGKNYKRVGYITVSTGIGVGITLESKPFLSTRGLASHLGFTTSRLGKSECGSGRVGTYESLASGKAIERNAKIQGYKNKTAKEIYNDHLQNKKWANKIINLSAQSIAELCANIKSIFDIDVIVIGGSIGMAKGYTLLVKKYLSNEPKLFQSKVFQSSLGMKAAKMGILL